MLALSIAGVVILASLALVSGFAGLVCAFASGKLAGNAQFVPVDDEESTLAMRRAGDHAGLAALACCLACVFCAVLAGAFLMEILP